ncbi:MULTISPECIES: helix-turn-helix domain-containing protein [Halorussus]|uniref:Helix-turn-helix domain-containing protein n=1 Tax=Halorussus aquaticus TaxID=2953748 RepID=A0ABD5Q329_9EURY|nr:MULTISPECIES: helix-turn-helix domain-containing protein [Halorussus]NEU56492.1 helix-turn-helix domain-containing protein [Halorussus sp. MSC15.2]
MEAVELLRVLGNKYNAEILRATNEPKSAQELSDELEIPIATSYRRIEELTEAELLELSGREFSDEGRRTKVYRRNVDALEISFEDGAIDVSAEDRPEVDNALADVWRDLKAE